jgi:maleate cis-trans isomerase
MLEYASKGLIGVLTPQANTTAETELSLLCPPGVGLMTARLTSDKATIDERLVDYVLSMETTLDRFANAPVRAVAFACTGAAYLVDPAQEQEELAQIAARRGYPIVTAANAVADAIAALGARRVGIVSPYGDELHEQALRYWEKRRLGVAKVTRIKSADEAFHPIYALGATASEASLDELGNAELDAVVMLGTGLPTLPTILKCGARPVPVLSPNLCLMWRSLLAIDGKPPSSDNLQPWLTGEAWAERFRVHVSA